MICASTNETALSTSLNESTEVELIDTLTAASVSVKLAVAPANVLGSPILNDGIIVKAGSLRVMSSSIKLLRFTSASVSSTGISSPEFHSPPNAAASISIEPKFSATSMDCAESL